MLHSADTQPVRPTTPRRALISSAVALLVGLVVLALAIHTTASKGVASSPPALAQSHQGVASSAPTGVLSQPSNLRTFQPSNSSQLTQDDPVALRPAPSRLDPTSRYYIETGH